MSVKVSKNFTIDELVHPKMITIHGAKRCIDFLHYKLISATQQIRNKFGRIVINGKLGGKTFTNSGLRLPFSRFGAKNSRHKQGCCIDGKFIDTDYRVVYKYIINNQDEFPYIVAMENIKFTRGWLHIEFGAKRNNGEKIKIFRPKR